MSLKAHALKATVYRRAAIQRQMETHAHSSEQPFLSLQKVRLFSGLRQAAERKRRQKQRWSVNNKTQVGWQGDWKTTGFLGKGENRKRASPLTPTPGKASNRAEAQSPVPRARCGAGAEPASARGGGQTGEGGSLTENQGAQRVPARKASHTPGAPTPPQHARAPSASF